MINKSFVPHAFTLLEMLLVVAIISLLAAIAVPNFVDAQIRAKVSRVKADMRSVYTAVECYSIDNNVPPLMRGLIDPQGNLQRPEPHVPGYQANRGGLCLVTDLTTPIAYMTSVNISDPFVSGTVFNEFGMRLPYLPITLPPMPTPTPGPGPTPTPRAGGGGPYYSESRIYYRSLYYMNITSLIKGWDKQIDFPHGRRASGLAQRHWARFMLASVGPNNVQEVGGFVHFSYAWFAREDRFRRYFYDPSNGTISRGDIVLWGD